MSSWKYWFYAVMVLLITYFALQGIQGLLSEVYGLSGRFWHLVLFPLTKAIGDIAALALQRRRGYFFLEDWVRESVRFALIYGLLAFVSVEIWTNYLQLSSYPDMVFIAVVCYLLMDYDREKRRSENMPLLARRRESR